MAWWQRQREKFVYVYYRVGGRATALARCRTKHLDGLNDAAIEIWVKDWQQKYARNCQPNCGIGKYIDKYCRHLKDKGRAPKTIWEHRYSLTQYALPFFLKRNPVIENPNHWPSRSLKFSNYIVNVRRQSLHTCRKVLSALRLFYKFLEEEGVVYTGMPLRIRYQARPAPQTPLKRAITPDEVLAFARQAPDEFGMLAVIGYFFSLRTFELMALRPADFIAGNRALDLECCRVLMTYGLFDRLAVRIHRQRSAEGEFREPKRASFGFVACFNREAAEWLVPRLNSRPTTELLFPHLPDVNIAKWRRYGIPGVTLKDLRRSSIYHLGHYSKVELIALKGHARHRFATTTELYLRRPVDVRVQVGPLDLAS